MENNLATLRPINALLALFFVVCLCPATSETTVRATVDRPSIGMGDSVTLESTVSTGYVATRSGQRVIPFVNGKRWGAIETTDARGNTTHLLPLPNTGIAEIQVT